MKNIFSPRKPSRLKNSDYSEQKYYYITVCTYNHLELFGAIENNKMVLNKYGRIAEDVLVRPA